MSSAPETAGVSVTAPNHLIGSGLDDAGAIALPPVSSYFYRTFKRGADVVLASTLLVVLSPVIAGIAIGIRSTGAKPLFSHSRIGKHGRPFQCYKFRSMVMNADSVLNQYLANNLEAREEWGRDQKLRKDPRVTRIGHFLRRSSLDEIPQLLNVLKGEMSLVGPRPVVHEELEKYGPHLSHYLAVRPGVTGLWQVSGRNDTGYDERVALDCWYVRNRSLWLDAKILLKTLAVPFRRGGAY